jgi:hypothetical protein
MRIIYTIGALIWCWCIKVHSSFVKQAMPLIPMVLDRGILLEVRDEKSLCQDGNFLFGATIKGRYFPALVPIYRKHVKGSQTWKVDQLKEILKLWVIRMEDSTYLKNLAESTCPGDSKKC